MAEAAPGAPMPGWARGLAGRETALRTARRGGVACLIIAALMLSAGLIKVGQSGKPLDHAIVWMIGYSLEPVIVAIAGFRMLRGAGRLSGSIAVLLLAVDLIVVASANPVSVATLGTVMVRVGLMAIVINGVRAAFALRYVDYSWELRDTFS